MNTRNKRIFAYSFLLLFMMACRTWGCNTPRNVLIAGNPGGSADFNCQRFLQLSADPHAEGFVCKLTCPTGTHTFDLYDKELSAFINTPLSEIQAQYCPGGAPVQQSLPAASSSSEEPTEAPAPPTETAPLKPYLTGAFTTCDNVAGYVNFTIADPAAPFDPATHKVLFNGVEAICTRAASAFDVLTCIYPPAPYGPPAIIEVFNGGERVNEFKFDGGKICDPASQPNTGGTEPEQPAATEAPTEPAPTDGD